MSKLGKRAVQAVLLLRAEATPTTTILSVIIDPQEYVGLSTNMIILSDQLIISKLGKRAVKAVVLLNAVMRRHPSRAAEGVAWIGGSEGVALNRRIGALSMRRAEWNNVKRICV